MTPPSAIIRQMLLDLEVGSAASDWPIQLALLLDNPDEVICVLDRAGKEDGRLMGTGERIRHPGIQVLLRGMDYPALYSKTIELAEALDAQRRLVVDIPDGESYLVHNISRMGEPMPLGIEIDNRKRRHSFSINATLTVSLHSTSFFVTEGEFLLQPGGDEFLVKV